MPEFPAELLPSLLKADTTSRASNADILSFFSKTPLLIDRLRYIRDSYKVVFTELLLEDDTRVGFYKESNDLLVWQGSYLTRSAESHLSWHSVTGTNAFNIFFFRQYFLSIPKDLENAAIVDGCSRLGVFFKIVLPNAKPAIATTAILSFRSVWNAFLWPMIVINDYDKLTLTVGLKYLKEWDPNWAVLLAGATISIVPIVIVFLLFQKYFMASAMNSGFGGK